MHQKINNFSPDVVIPAIEENLREYWGYYGRAPQSELVDGPEFLRFYTGVPFPFLNGVSSYQLSPDHVDAEIDESIAYFQKRNAIWEWIVGPQPAPASLPESLAKHGLKADGGSPGMAIHLDAISQDLPTIDQLEIVPIKDDETLKIWASTALGGFELPDLHPTFVNLECSLGCQQPFYRRYLAHLHHQPVATSALYLGENVAGIYCVSTVPTARRLGIGAAVTLRALHEARAMRYHIAVLQASPMGRSVYQKLGFQEFSVLYGYSPAE